MLTLSVLSCATAEKPPEDVLLLAQTEQYVEYDAAGRVIKGQEVKARSRYEEDVYINNHSSVWGSWWSDGTWGYACCHQTVKNSYCTGKAGEQAAAETAEQMLRNMEQKAQQLQAAAEEDEQRRAASTLSNSHFKADVWGAEAAGDVELDEQKLKAALDKQAQRDSQQVETDERKRKYNSLAADEEDIGLEEMEVYRMKKNRAEDPINAFKSKGGSDGKYDLL